MGCDCCCRPVYTRQEWEDALQEDGSIIGFDEIVDQIEQRVSGAAAGRTLLTSSCQASCSESTLAVLWQQQC